MGSKQTARWGISVKAASQSLRSVRGFGGFALNDFLDKSLKSFKVEVAWRSLRSVRGSRGFALNDFLDKSLKSFKVRRVVNHLRSLSRSASATLSRGGTVP